MTRAVFHGTAVQRATGQIEPNAEVQVRLPDGSLASIYKTRTGTDPSDEEDNPFFAQPNGDFMFYAETPGRYDVFCHDGQGNAQHLKDIVMVSELTSQNPMNSAGDMIIGGTGGETARLAAGANGSVLGFAGGVPAWVPGAFTALEPDDQDWVTGVSMAPSRSGALVVASITLTAGSLSGTATIFSELVPAAIRPAVDAHGVAFATADGDQADTVKVKVTTDGDVVLSQDGATATGVHVGQISWVVG